MGSPIVPRVSSRLSRSLRMPQRMGSDFGGVVASGNSVLVGESIASWSAGFHLSHLS